jgi:hypothetical protein
MSVSASVVELLILFALTGLGVLVVLYGTVVKNRWGINLEPVSCPRCKTPLPALRKPGSLRQALWGGWRCPVCGAGVDKWGREVAAAGPATPPISEEEMRRLLKRRLIFAAPGLFCLFLALDWTGLTGTGFPSDWAQAFIQVCVNIGFTVFATAVSFSLIMYCVKRLPRDRSARRPVQRGWADRNRRE